MHGSTEAGNAACVVAAMLRPGGGIPHARKRNGSPSGEPSNCFSERFLQMRALPPRYS
jgi:hypothetical protein